jgi:predicted Zn-dependent protease
MRNSAARVLLGVALATVTFTGTAQDDAQQCRIPLEDIAAVHERQLRALNATVTQEPAPTARAQAIFQRLVDANGLQHRAYRLRAYAVGGFNGSAVFPSSVVLSQAAMEPDVADEEIAAVIAHELAHLELAHAVTQACEQAKLAPSPLGFQDSAREFERESADNPEFAAEFTAMSRQHEKEADAHGLNYLANAGYAPASLAQMLQHRVGDRTVSPTHPPMTERMAALLSALAASAKPAQ